MDFIKKNLSILIISFFSLLFFGLFLLINENKEKDIYLLLICMFNAIIPSVYVLQNKYSIDFFDQKHFFIFPISKGAILLKEIIYHFLSFKNIIILSEIIFFLFYLENFTIQVYIFVVLLIFFQNFSLYCIIVSIKNLFYNKRKRIKALGEFAVVINVISVFSSNQKSPLFNLSYYSPLHKSLFILHNYFWIGSLVILLLVVFVLFNLAKRWSLD
jgi:hypothetical protein